MNIDLSKIDYDVDVLLLYAKDASASEIAKAKIKLISEGKTVYSAADMPENLRYRELLEIK